MSKQKLNVAAMTEELGPVASFAARPPVSATPEKMSDNSAVSPQAFGIAGDTSNAGTQSPATMEESAPVPSSGRPFAQISGRRTTTRYSFEFFQDQVESLKGLSLEEQLRGEKGSMSQMVREAVDAYIAKRMRDDAG